MKEKLPHVRHLHSDDKNFLKNNTFPTSRIHISFINSVFYCMSSKRVKSVLLKLSRISEVIVLGEGMANLEDEYSKFIINPPCFQHPYKKWLNDLNFIESWSEEAPDPRPQCNKFIVFRKKSEAIE